MATRTYAQAVPDNVYYVPLPEQQLQDAFKILAVANPISNTISVNISIVSTGDNAIIYYDHWEDSYQASYPGTLQASTQVWGDNNPSNGIPPGYTTDVIMSGDRINLMSSVVLPRNAGTLFFDGRDRIASTQFLAVTRVAVPTVPGSVLGSSVEVYDTTVYDREFQLPIGETTDQNAGATCCLFEYTSIFVMARENATTIQIDADGNGTTDFTATLNQGESYHLSSAIVGDVRAGAKVTANKPIQVDLVTGDIGATYESRTFAMYPTVLWDNCYYNPVGRTSSAADVNAFIYNPGPSTLTINARTTTGTTSFTVGPKATFRYNMPDNSGAHFFTNNEADRFFAVGVHDADITEQSQWDWGFSLLPEVFLSTAGVVGYGPGTSNPATNTGNGSPVWVLATKATTIYADFDGDPTTGPLTDPNGGKYNAAFPVIADQSLRIFDNTDRDQTGMRVYTLDGTRIAVAWGEDAATAGAGLPFLDLGTSVTPDRKIVVGKLATITVDNGQLGVIDPGDEITYRITVENQSLRSRNVVSLTDTIPAGLQYIAGSTRRNRTIVIPDQTAPNTVFPLDQSGYAIGDLILGQKDTLSFRVVATRSIVAEATVTNRVRYSDSRGDNIRGQVTVNINQNFAPVANRNDTTTTFNTNVIIPILRNDVDRALRPAGLSAVALPTVSVQAKNGVATVNTDGTITYNPNDTFAGRDTLIYRLCDNLNTNLCDTTLVTVIVLSAPPVANPNSVTTAFNTNVAIAVLGNDFDKAGRSASLTNVSAPVITSPPANGTVSVVNGVVTYNPNDTFAGTDSFIYRICDLVDPTQCDTALVRINVLSAPPIANPNSVTTTFNTDIAIAVLGNDFDKAGRPASLTNVSAPVITSPPANGTVSVVNGVVTYNPNDTFAGTDSFIYRICDLVDPTKCDTALVRINVLSAPPVANPNSVTTTFNTNIAIAVLGNDVDKAGRPASLTNVSAPVITSPPANGTVSVVNGVVTYNPNDTFTGTDTFIYRICDNINTSLCDTALVRVVIQSAPPVANPNTVTTAFNTNVTIPVLGNDVDKANRPASLTNVSAPVISSQPANGTVVVNADGSISYNPNDTFTGTDSFIYRLCDDANTSLCDTALVTINVLSAPPVANPNSVTTAFNTNITIGVLGNDVDKANRPASLTNVSAPEVIDGPINGAAMVNADGSISYNPNDTFAGTDTFIYRICDLVDPSQCDTALVRVVIQSAPPVANRDNVNLAFNQTVTIAVLGNDVDKANRPASLTNVTAPVITTQPANGTVVINADGSISYNPNDTFAGTDSFIYRICDIIDPTRCDTALVVLNVGSLAPNAAPDVSSTPFNTPVTVSILGNDVDKANQPANLANVTAPVITSQPASGTAVINADGTLTYTPNSTFAGTDVLTYRICDNVNTALCDQAQVTITVNSAPPIANRNDVTTPFRTNVLIAILGNDVDKANRPASLTNVTTPVIINQANNGVASVNADGSITYNPNETFAGRDTLIYQICDIVNNSLCDTALVTILIQSAPPVANPNSVTTAFNTDIAIAVLGNDFDKAGRPASLTNVSAPVITSQPANGTVSVVNGVVTYNPNDTFAGTDSFIYRICDLVDPTKCDTALVRVVVQSAPPVANPNSVTTTFNTNIAIAVLGNDVDKAGRPASLINVSAPVITAQPTNGTVVVVNGVVTYNPNDTFAGTDSFVYQICDLVDPTKCDTALVTILIQSAPPVANPNSVTTTFNTDIAIAVLGNDLDKANRPASLTNVSAPVIATQPANGTVVVNADGSISYNPNDTFAGTDSFIYRICDLIDPTRCDTALVRVVIQSAPPVANPNSVTTTFNTNIAIAVLGNDVDKAGRPASLTNVTAPVITRQPANGTVSVVNGVVTYNPNDTFAGTDSFVYQICDLIDPTQCDTALVRVVIQSAPPVANPNSVTTTFNTNIAIAILGNDVDKAGRPASLTNVTAPVITRQPANGTVATVNGVVTYNPNDTFAGTDSFVYQICDLVDPTKCDTALVTILIQSAPPVANPNSVTTTFNTDITIAVLGNDQDKAGRPANLTNVTIPVISRQPANGMVVVNTDGSISYNPNDTFAGTDSFIYQLCDVIDPTQCDTALVTVVIGSAPPVANEDVATTPFTTSIAIAVLGNDLDKAGRPASLINVTGPVIIDQPRNGTASVSNGVITYTPANTFAGPDTLRYQICDLINPALCDTALVVINIGSSPPMANRNDATTAFNTNTTIPILGNDVDKAGRPASLTNVTAPVIISPARNGQAIVNADGTITYNPSDAFAGRDTLFYRICDVVDPTQCDTALVTINILSAPPTANPDGVNLAFNQTVTVPVLTNDFDKANHPASLTNVTAPVITAQPANGTAVVNADGTITYNPNNTFAGTDVLTYRICDVIDPTQCTTAIVTFTVGSLAPNATSDVVNTPFNQNITIPVLANDTDKAGQPARITSPVTVTPPQIISGPANGTAIVFNGVISYNPDDAFAGIDTLRYRICDVDNPSLCATALVVINVGSAPPVAVRNDTMTAFNTPVSIAVLGNDQDKAGRPASLTNVTAPVITELVRNGTATVDANGVITYTPNAGFAGRDTLRYRICDNIDNSLCDTALVTILIQSIPPTANAEDRTTAFNTNLTIPILANDTDRSGNPASLTNVTAPVIIKQTANGSVVVNADRTITYNPNDAFAGYDTLIYRICDIIDPTQCDTALVTLNVLSAPPVATDDLFSVDFNVTVTVPVLANDTDKAGQPASPTNVQIPVLIQAPKKGAATVNIDGTITYNPDDAFAGSDTLFYQICDNINPNLCDTARVVFNIGSAAPNANQDQVTAAFNTTIPIAVLSNDTDKASRQADLSDVTLPVIVAQPRNGTATVDVDGRIIYNPNDTFAGLDTLTYRICDIVNPALCDDALVIINVLSAPPVANPNSVTTAFNTDIVIAVLGNDVDKAGRPASLTNVTAPVITRQPANGLATINPDGTITYVPNGTFAGTDSFIYQICDSFNPTLCDTAFVTINVLSAPPVANDDQVIIGFNTTVTVPVLANDADKAGRPANLTLVTAPVIIAQPANGTAVVNANGSITYNPDDTFAGRDTLIYQICDVDDPTQCDTARVIFNVGSSAPNATPDVVSTNFNTNVVISVLANDTDKASLPASLTNVTAPQLISPPVNGTAVVNADGSIIYNPNDTFAGQDTLRYQICDIVNPALCDTALVAITVGSLPPVANPNSVTTTFNTGVVIAVLANDTDKTAQPASLTNVTAPQVMVQPQNGTITVAPDGTLSYVPNRTFAGRDSLIYQICDLVDPTLCDTALVVINVQSAPPVANDNNVNLAFNVTVTVPVLANDADKAGRPANLTLVTAPVIIAQPANGTAVVNANGSITYNPDDTFAGRDTLIYQICDVDDPTQCDTARVIFNVGSSAPNATPDVVSTNFNTNVVISVLANDTDKASLPASLTNVTAPQLIGQPTNGTVVVNADGTITYNPNDTFAGTDTFQYRICDLVDPSQCDTTMVMINVRSAPPVANREDVTANFNTSISITVLANDIDKAGRPADAKTPGAANVTIPVIITQAKNGVATVNDDGTISIVYNPNNTFAGRDSLIYQICDLVDPTLCDTALVSILIRSAPPVASDDDVNLALNQSITVAILGNDTDKAGLPASLTGLAGGTVTAPIIVDQPRNGTAVVNADGSLSYTPSSAFAGQDTLIYRICDVDDPTLCDTATVIFSIGSAPPIANQDATTTVFNTNVTVPVLINDTDRASRPATLTEVTPPVIIDQPRNGTAVVNADGTITYTPANTFAGQDTLRYQICDVVNPALCDTTMLVIKVGSAPPVANPDSSTTTFATSVSVVILANDVDKVGQTASLTNVSAPVIIRQASNGQAGINPDGSLSYTPNNGFAGRDTLIYRICDLVDPTQCDTALVVIAILSAPPVANPEQFNLAFNATVTVTVLNNDVDKAGFPASLFSVTAPVIVSQPKNGTAVANPDGSITYDPNDNFARQDTLQYRICDVVDLGLCDTTTVIFNVGSAAPNANQDVANTAFNTVVTIPVLANDTDKTSQQADLTDVTTPVIIDLPTNGTAVVNGDGTITYTPGSQFAGLDTLRYTICDLVNPALCDTAFVVINVGSAAPTVNPDDAATAFNTPVSLTVTANDLDKAGQPANPLANGNVTAPVVIRQPANGIATIDSNGILTYTPNAGFAGQDTLLYRICDVVDNALCDMAQVIISVGSARPVANDDTPDLVPFNTNVTIPVLDNDLDRTGQLANLTTITGPVLIGQPANGTAIANADGSITYNPNDTFAGQDTLRYQICDIVNPALCDTALVVIRVLPRIVASLGGVVFNDLNRNGTRELAEPGIAGVKVILYRQDSTALTKLDSALSQGTGDYAFLNLPSGIYQVQFVPANGFTFTQANVGVDDTRDSDAQSGGFSEQILLDAVGSGIAKDNRTVFAGLIDPGNCLPPVCLPIIIQKTKSAPRR